MDAIRKARKNSLILALILTFALPLGGVLLGVGLAVSRPAVWAIGIAGLAVGFYGCPIAWVGYGNKVTYYRFVSAIEEEHIYEVRELAAQLGISEKEVRNRIDVCFNKRWLNGYKREGDSLILNTGKHLRDRERANVCPNCGATYSYKEAEDQRCPYCGSPTVKE